MPTNILRDALKRPAAASKPAAHRRRTAMITAGRVSLRVELLDTATADRLWAALPLFSTAQTWGESIHFETPVETGRERSARVLSTPGEVCYWVEDDRVIIAFGRTPISRPHEIRLPSPCNLWGRAIDDVRALKAVRPGEKVGMRALASGVDE